MSRVPDAWEDEWSNVADTNPATESSSTEPKKLSSKVTKAQKRAQQAEFNRQLWAEAEGPKETNYFLESRNVVPLRSEYKPPPVLLSRKGPIIQSRKPPTSGLESLSLNDSSTSHTSNNQESSEDEEDLKAKELSLAERQAQAARDREEKQRKYEERRQELFGTSSASVNTSQQQVHHNNRSGTSTPASLTPPGSRSATPNRGGRGRGGRGRGGGVGGGGGPSNTSTRTQSRGSQHRELYDPSYTQKPAREDGATVHGHARTPEIHPIRTPKGPDGSGRGGFGFANPRGGQGMTVAHTSTTTTAEKTSVLDPMAS